MASASGAGAHKSWVSQIAMGVAVLLALLASDWDGLLTEPSARLWLMAAALGCAAVAVLMWQRPPWLARIAGAALLAVLAGAVLFLGQDSILMSVLTALGTTVLFTLQCLGARKNDGAPVHDALEQRYLRDDLRPPI